MTLCHRESALTDLVLQRTASGFARKSTISFGNVHASDPHVQSGTDVNAAKQKEAIAEGVRNNFLGRVVSFNTDTSRAVRCPVLPPATPTDIHMRAKLYTHRKLLIAVLNGPVMG